MLLGGSIARVFAVNGSIVILSRRAWTACTAAVASLGSTLTACSPARLVVTAFANQVPQKCKVGANNVTQTWSPHLALTTWTGEEIAEGGNADSPGVLAGENHVTAGWDFDLRVSTPCGDETVLPAAPFQYLPAAVDDRDKILLVRDMTGIADLSDPDVQIWLYS